MVVFFVTHGARQPLESFLTTWAGRLAARAGVVFYEELFGRRLLPAAATYVFTDLERLSPEALDETAGLADQLTDYGTVLNHPRGAVLRFELLQELFESGDNPFQVYRALDVPSPRRFPVFLRNENDHEGPASDLLRTQRALDAELARRSLRGDRLDSLIVVEFEDTTDERGVYRKYMLNVIGDELVLGRPFFSSHWVVKYSDVVLTEEQRAEELEVLTATPPPARLGEIAARAGIQFGRFDYAYADDRLCVWELNTNPWLMLPPKPEEPAHRFELADRLTSALEQLAGEGPREDPVEVQLSSTPPVVPGAPRRPSPGARRLLQPLAYVAPRTAFKVARRKAAQ